MNMAEDPDLERRVAMQMFRQVKEMLHSGLVYQRNTNQAHELLRTVLPVIVEASPDEGATSEMRKKHAEGLKDFLEAMDLHGGMAKKAKLATIRRRELEQCEELKKAVLAPNYKRKSPNTKVNTPRLTVQGAPQPRSFVDPMPSSMSIR